jgi:hypothetical protein
MKRLSFTLALFLAVGADVAVSADESPAPAPSPVARPTSTKSAKILKGEVVSADPAGTITYKTSDGGEKSAAVETDVAEKLRDLKPGDKVTLILREDGGEQTVMQLKKTASAKSPERSPVAKSSEAKPSASP